MAKSQKKPAKDQSEIDEVNRSRLLRRRAEMFAERVRALEERLARQLQREAVAVKRMNAQQLRSYEAAIDAGGESAIDAESMVASTTEAVPTLARREIECLNWTMEGKTAWEVAGILGVRERTAVFYLGNAVRKLGCVNKRQAVVRALQLGLIG